MPDQQLVIGGKALGSFVIENADEDWKRLDNKGNLLALAVNISLKEYVVPDQNKSCVTTAVSAAATVAKAAGLADKITALATGTGLNAAAIAGLSKTAIAAIKDPVSALTGATGLLNNIKGLQDVSQYISLAKNKDYAEAISTIMGGSVDAYNVLGVNVKDIVSKAASDPTGAITDILTKIQTGGEPMYKTAQALFGDTAAGPVMQLSQKTDELKQAFKEAVKL